MPPERGRTIGVGAQKPTPLYVITAYNESIGEECLHIHASYTKAGARKCIQTLETQDYSDYLDKNGLEDSNESYIAFTESDSYWEYRICVVFVHD